MLSTNVFFFFFDLLQSASDRYVRVSYRVPAQQYHRIFGLYLGKYQGTALLLDSIQVPMFSPLREDLFRRLLAANLVCTGSRSSEPPRYCSYQYHGCRPRLCLWYRKSGASATMGTVRSRLNWPDLRVSRYTSQHPECLRQERRQSCSRIVSLSLLHLCSGPLR